MSKRLTLLAAAGIVFALGLQGCATGKPAPEAGSSAPAAAVATAQAAPAAAATAAISAPGKQYVQDKCLGCHKLEAFAAADRKVKNFTELRNKIDACSEAAKTGWHELQKREVLTYLNTEFYKFK